MEKRKDKRLFLNVPLHVEGKVSEGDVLEEDSFSTNISRTGICFLSNSEYEMYKPLTLNIHLSYPLSNGVPAGDYNITGTITRCDPAMKTKTGQSESQWIAVAFHFPLPSAPDVWGDRRFL